MTRGRRFAACFAVLCLCLSLFVVPARAEYINDSSFWQWVAGDNRFLRNVTGYVPGLGVCPDVNSPDGKHHADSVQLGEVLGNYICKCKYCGQEFIAHESDMQSAYNDYVDSMPVSGVDNEGGFLWYPDWSDTTRWSLTYYFGTHFADGNDTLPIIENGKYVTQGARHIYGKFNYNYRSYSFNFAGDVTLPISGTYSYIRSEAVKHYNDSGGGDVAYYNDTSLGMKAAGNSVSFNVGGRDVGGNEHDVYAILPIFRVVPVEQFPVETTNKYVDTTRPANLRLDVTINNENPTPAPSSEIVNETTNTVYNPVTGDTTTYNNWQYDYSSRTYTLTNSQGDTTTVTYGDQNITINQGGNTYNVYYLTQQPEHHHSYAVTTERLPTCAGTGSRTYTCSSCGHTYTEAIPALGHEWQIKSSALTEYDEHGEVVSEGYTIYRCARCGEERKSVDGTVPASGAGDTDSDSLWSKLGELLGTVGGGLLGLLGSFFGAILDALISLATMIGEKLAAIVEMVTGWFTSIPQLFTGFLALLTAIFPFVPAEVTLLLTFGLAAVVFIGIIKAIRR